MTASIKRAMTNGQPEVVGNVDYGAEKLCVHLETARGKRSR